MELKRLETCRVQSAECFVTLWEVTKHKHFVTVLTQMFRDLYFTDVFVVVFFTRYIFAQISVLSAPNIGKTCLLLIVMCY